MTVFQVIISLAHSPKYSYKSHKLFWALTNISHILPKYFSHIIQLVLSQIFPILLPNLGSHKHFLYYPTWAHTNTSHTITKIGSQNYIISIKAQNHLSCEKNPKGLTKLLIKPVVTWHSY